MQDFLCLTLVQFSQPDRRTPVKIAEARFTATITSCNAVSLACRHFETSSTALKNRWPICFCRVEAWLCSSWLLENPWVRYWLPGMLAGHSVRERRRKAAEIKQVFYWVTVMNLLIWYPPRDLKALQWWPIEAQAIMLIWLRLAFVAGVSMDVCSLPGCSALFNCPLHNMCDVTGLEEWKELCLSALIENAPPPPL